MYAVSGIPRLRGGVQMNSDGSRVRHELPNSQKRHNEFDLLEYSTDFIIFEFGFVKKFVPIDPNHDAACQPSTMPKQLPRGKQV